MALQSSGPISLADIQTEFGGSNPIGLNEYYGVDTGIPSSGQISIGDFYGATNTPWAPTQSTTLTSSQSWTVPSGITTVRFTLTGGTFVPFWTSGWPGSTMGLRFKYNGTQPTPASAQAAFEAWENAHGASGTLGGAGNRTASRPLTVSYTLNTGETITVDEFSSLAFGTVNGVNNFHQTGVTIVRGTYTSWPVQSPSTSSSYVVSGVWVQTMDLYVPVPDGYVAPDASMFGSTATGKLSGTANTTGPTTISVTPGQSYSFTGGSLTPPISNPFTITSTNASVFLEW